MKTYIIEYQSVYQYWTSDKSVVKVKAESEFDAECKLYELLDFDGETLKTQLYSFRFLKKMPKQTA